MLISKRADRRGALGLAIAAAVVLSAAGVPAPAEAVQAQYPVTPRTQCSFGGWSVDPEGQNVRAAPSADAQVVGRLAPYVAPAGMPSPYGSIFSVVAARDAWFFIDTVSDPYVRGGRIDYRTSPLRGWISGRYIRFRIISELGFAEPSARARQIYSGDPQPPFERLLDCRGEFGRVQMQGGRQPWFRGICGMPDFCDGVLGDRRR
jgi:hypothetical protein